jgi:hypothetical protein
VAAAGLAADESAESLSTSTAGQADLVGSVETAAGCAVPTAPCGPTWMLTGGVDYTSAYYRRGYLQDDSGLILQPFLTGACCLNPGSPVLVQPYLTSWNSFGILDLDDPMATMVEGMGGVFLTWNHLALDANYAFYDSSPVDADSALQEAALKLTGDLGPLWAGPGPCPSFSLRPSVGLAWETCDERGTEDGYVEVGLEPSWRLPWTRRRMALAVPLLAGFSAKDYYLDSAGDDESLGYVAAGLSASVALPQGMCGAHWFLTAALQYTRLVADNLIEINDGDPDVIVAKAGLGFSL